MFIICISVLTWSICSDFFFFKQKTAYEMLRSLVGSEMCIRDSVYTVVGLTRRMVSSGGDPMVFIPLKDAQAAQFLRCLLYTSDAADIYSV